MNKLLSCPLWLLLLGLPSWATDPEISAVLEPEKAHVGDPIKLTIQIRHDGSWTFPKNALKEELDEARVLKSEWVVPEVPENQGDAERYLEIHAEVAWYELGEKVLPEIELVAQEAGEALPRTFLTPELKVDIVALLEEGDEEVAPAKGQLDMEIPPIWLILTAVAILLLAALAVFLVWLSRRPRKEVVIPPKPALPPYEEALRALEELTSGTLLKEGRVKEFYVVINHIVRHYYSRLFDIHAEEMTSYEMETWFADHPHLVSEEVAQWNTVFQELCDRVKFAKYDPVEAENQENVNRAYQIVEKLKPQPVSPDTPAGDDASAQKEDDVVAAG